MTLPCCSAVGVMIQAPPSKVKIFDSLPLVPVSFKLAVSPPHALFSAWELPRWDLLRLLFSLLETWFCNTASGFLANRQLKVLRFSKASSVSSQSRFFSTATSHLSLGQCAMGLRCGTRMCSQHLFCCVALVKSEQGR